MNVPERYWRFPTSEAIESLASRFGFPVEPNMQDWEYEVADALRLGEFLRALEGHLTDDERFTLAETVMQCFEDVEADGFDGETIVQWNRFEALLRQRPALHAFTLCYWSGHEESAMPFRVSHRVRALWTELRSVIDRSLV